MVFNLKTCIYLLLLWTFCFERIVDSTLVINTAKRSLISITQFPSMVISFFLKCFKVMNENYTYLSYTTCSFEICICYGLSQEKCLKLKEHGEPAGQDSVLHYIYIPLSHLYTHYFLYFFPCITPKQLIKIK